MNKQIKKSITILALIAFLSTNIAYGDTLRNVMMSAKEGDSKSRFEEAKDQLTTPHIFTAINMNNSKDRRYRLSLALATSLILHATFYYGVIVGEP